MPKRKSVMIQHRGLALTLRIGEFIQIGPDIFITLTKATSTKALMVIDAPRDISVSRSTQKQKPLEAA